MKSTPLVFGAKTYTTLRNGRRVRVVKLNNAATTPTFVDTLKHVERFFHSYGALHRGAGPHANATVESVRSATQHIRTFVGTQASHSILYATNTSAAINMFARMLTLTERDVILTSCIEHTSNNLPWKYNTRARVIECKALPDGSIDMENFESLAKRHNQHLKWVVMTGASNLTGYIPDITRLATIAHINGAKLFIDAAQLAPHRPIDMKKQGIDALAFSAHKVYSPFGLGVLILPQDMLDRQPVDPGGGSVDMIAHDHVLWSPTQERHQTGTLNVTGIVALGESCRIIMDIGWEHILAHEEELVRYAAKALSKIPGLKMHVPEKSFLLENRIGTFPFSLHGYHHAYLSAILDYEYGIETRAGTICNHRLVRGWFDVDDVEQKRIEEKIASGNRLASYGIVRASLGIYNTKKDIDALINALQSIQQHGPQLTYTALPQEETYKPKI